MIYTLILSLLLKTQILSRTKGGKIGRATRGVDMGLRTITFVKDAVKPGGYFGSEMPKSLAIIKCHQDEVYELPESATLLAYSDKCNVEMASIGNHLLCIQGHPEYNKEILFEIIDRVVNMKLMEVFLLYISSIFNIANSKLLNVNLSLFVFSARFCR